MLENQLFIDAGIYPAEHLLSAEDFFGGLFAGQFHARGGWADRARCLPTGVERLHYGGRVEPSRRVLRSPIR